MIFTSSRVPVEELKRVTGWLLRPEGLCRDDLRVPFRSVDPALVELAAAADALSMPLVHDARHALWALGAEAGGRALRSVVAPELDRFALSPDEVVRRSRTRPIEEATAAVHFALGQALHARGAESSAIEHFREAHRLHPTNWTYRRDAWSLAGADREVAYRTSWVDEVKREGAENCHPPLRL